MFFGSRTISRGLTTAFYIFASYVSSARGAHVLWSNDFENGVGAAIVPASGVNHITITHGIDPTNPNNHVGVVTDKGATASTTEWGEVRHNAAPYFALQPLNIIAGVDTSNFSVRVYIPSASVVSSNDQINMILRYSNDSGAPTGQFSTNNRGGVLISALARDTWHTLSWNNISVLTYAPLAEGQPATALYLTPIITFSDYVNVGQYNSAGVFAYFDDILLVTTPEPSKALLCFLGLLALGLHRRK